MIHIAFKILVFYKTDDALEQYINRFRSVSQESLVTSSKNERLYLFDGVQVACIRGLNENMRGRWADFVAVQEDLTWGDTWEEMSYVAMVEAYSHGWMYSSIFSAPETQMCRGALYDSAFAAAGILI